MNNFYMEKIQESIQNSFKEIFSGNVSPRTIQTRLKENIDKLTSETIENINIPVDNTVNISESVSEKIPSVGFSKWNIFKIILAILIIGLLAINAYTYITYGKDAFTFFLVNDNSNEIDKIGGDWSSNGSSKVTKSDGSSKVPKSDGSSKGNIEGESEVSDDKATTAIHSSIDIEAKKLSKKEKVDESDIERALKKNNKNSYKANNLSNNVNKKVGYCYIGADRNVRTCVKVGENDTCMSGEVFPTMDLCINPNLKE